MKRSERADLQGLNTMLHVINRACRRGEMKDVVNRTCIVRPVHVEFKELKGRLFFQMRDVAQTSSQEIVHANHMMALRQKRVAQMRADETRTARNQNPHKI